MAEQFKYKFIHVSQDATKEMHAGKPVYYIFNNRSNEAIGKIYWFAPWRMWATTLRENSVWSSGCLADVRDAIKRISEAEVKNG